MADYTVTARKTVQHPAEFHPERGCDLEASVRICADLLQEGAILVFSNTYNADVAVLGDMGYSEEKIEELIVIDHEEEWQMPTTTHSEAPRVTRPFDEDTYPRLRFSRQQLDCIALAREMHPKPIRTRVVAERFGWTKGKAYQVLRRLRDKGVFHSQLRWITLSKGNHAARVEPDGTRRLFSWLVLHLRRMEKWGSESDQIQKQFRPRREA